MELEHFYICLTRKCNLTCKHCLCGDPQYIDIAYDYIKTFFNIQSIRKIKNITLTGGEPFLNIHGILAVALSIRDSYMDIENVSIVSNGHVWDGLFDSQLKTINEILPCNMTISFSNDQYHTPLSYVVDRFNMRVRNLDKISFNVREYKEHTYDGLIESKRAKENGINGRIKPLKANKDFNSAKRKTLTVNDNIVLSDILDWEQEDDPSNILCHVNDFDRYLCALKL